MNTQYKEVDEVTFWKLYLKILNIQINTLSDSDIELLSHVLAGDPYKSQVRREFRLKIRKKLKMSNSRFTHLKDSLISKGFLKGEGSDLMPHPNMNALQIKVKKMLKEKGEFDISLDFPIKILSNDNNE